MAPTFSPSKAPTFTPSQSPTAETPNDLFFSADINYLLWNLTIDDWLYLNNQLLILVPELEMQIENEYLAISKIAIDLHENIEVMINTVDDYEIDDNSMNGELNTMQDNEISLACTLYLATELMGEEIKSIHKSSTDSVLFDSGATVRIRTLFNQTFLMFSMDSDPDSISVIDNTPTQDTNNESLFVYYMLGFMCAVALLSVVAHLFNLGKIERIDPCRKVDNGKSLALFVFGLQITDIVE